MAKKDPKRTKHGGVKSTKPRPQPNAAGAAKGGGRESAGASESEIKRLDREIIRLINRRAAVTAKWIQSQPSPLKILFSPVADEHLTELIERGNPGPLPEPAVRGVFREIVSGARGIVKTLRIAYLGPAYSFTHLAAMERFGGSATFIPVNNIAADVLLGLPGFEIGNMAGRRC